WNEDGELELLDGGVVRSRSALAQGASFDGSVVVGGSNRVAPNDDAFVWTRGEGLSSISDILNRHGAMPQGWQVHVAYAVSADGRTITGYGYNPAGMREGWVVTIPAPGSAVIAMAGLAIAGHRRRRSTACRAPSPTAASSCESSPAA